MMESFQDLCIDSRRPKRPIGSTTYAFDKDSNSAEQQNEHMSQSGMPPKAPSSRGKNSRQQNDRF